MEGLRIPLVDAIITVHGIGPVFVDTVLSIVQQRTTSFRLRCLVVVDGCPEMEDTYPLLMDLAASSEFELEVLFQKNTGVACARNRGIRHFLEMEEQADYIFFMDGDDIAPPNFLQAGVDTLETAEPIPGITARPGWAYADQFHFGDNSHWVQYPQELWGARFALSNLSQPSSLLKMDLLRDGVRFDPDFNVGIEDWEFWCAAVEAGYYGVRIPNTIMRYRRLLGARSSFNRSNDDLTKFRLTKKYALDKYETIIRDHHLYPRVGQACQEGGQATAAASQSRTAVLTLDEAGISKLWANVTMLRRSNRETVFDTPYVPDLLAYSTTSERLPPDLAFMAEHLFGWHKALAALEVKGLDGAPCLLFAPRRLDPLDATSTPHFADFDPFNESHEKLEIQPTFPNTFSPEALHALDQLMSARVNAPLRRGHLTRRLVGDKFADPWIFFRETLGFLPYFPEPNLADAVEKVVFIVPECDLRDEGTVTHIDALARDAEFQDAARHLLVIRSATSRGVEMPAGLQDLFGRGNIHRLFSIRPDAHRALTSKFYNGTQINLVDEEWSRYAMGCLSWFDKIVNIGHEKTTFALSPLRKVKATTNIYIPRNQVSELDEIERLCMLLGVYDEIRNPSDAWRDLAIGLGVTPKLFKGLGKE
ncbi:glycosyltransferase family 2 protein [Roseovarius salinarum]|uniref:glycosyltransferase family 2 protein n=1 Tax=Roseovarius salinarum TaxID=1981892 RepID=UPI000C329BEE|nr:glycosyltransferase family A protein [Roseovarius salinarum]